MALTTDLSQRLGLRLPLLLAPMAFAAQQAPHLTSQAFASPAFR